MVCMGKKKYKIKVINNGWFKNQHKIVKNKCLICNNYFEFYPSVRNRKFCSLKCYRISQKGKKRPEHSKFMKEAHRNGIANNKGAKGYKHTKENRQKFSNNMKNRWRNSNDYVNSNKFRQIISDQTSERCAKGMMNTGYSRAKTGWFDKGKKRYFMRSGWELNYALYLNWLIEQKKITDWEYEVDTFWFKKIKRGVRSYKPDFKIYNLDKTTTYHEVKGYMDNKSKTKLKRMAKYYPEVKLILIDYSVYGSIKRQLGKMLNFS